MPEQTETARTFRKTATVQAMQWDPGNPGPVLSWLEEHHWHHRVFDDGRLGLGTLESGEDLDHHTGTSGDWVLRGTHGEFYICESAVFAASYEQA